MSQNETFPSIFVYDNCCLPVKFNRILGSGSSVPRSSRLLPIIESIDESRTNYSSTLRKINSQLKIIGEMAGISTKLTTYVARHSWASIAKHKGIDIATISDALGHDNIKTTEIYLSSIGTDRLERANAKILRDL